MKTFGFALATALVAGASVFATAGDGGSPAPTLSLTPIGSIKTGLFRSEDPRVAEINAYDAANRRVYVVNPQNGGLDVLDVSNPAAPIALPSLDLVGLCEAARPGACPIARGGEPNSVAIRGGLMAVAYANATRTANGHVVIVDLKTDGSVAFAAAIEVGALPDMVAISEDGRWIVTANEGEPDPTYTTDPAGTISIVDVRRLGRPGAVRHVGFEEYDTAEGRAKLAASGVRVFGPGAPPSRDLEPEYVAISGRTAYVTLQEANAIAVIDLPSARLRGVAGLGLKDHTLPGQGLDPSDQDGGVRIGAWPVRGLYQPDAVAAYADGKRTYLIMANEGDAREYAAYTETLRVGSSRYLLDSTAFPNAAALKANSALGRLTVSTASGDLDGDGDFDRTDVLGGRSISVRDEDGRLLWDSGDFFEQLSASLDASRRSLFNTTNSANTRENRSDDKGIEPESIVIGRVDGRPYAFVGLERDSGIVVFDLKDPKAPRFVTYANNRRFPRVSEPDGAFLPCGDVNDCGDLGPEGLTFVPARQSPTGKALLIVSNEVSSSTTIWQID